jgi:hypothetical protein
VATGAACGSQLGAAAGVVTSALAVTGCSAAGAAFDPEASLPPKDAADAGIPPLLKLLLAAGFDAAAPLPALPRLLLLALCLSCDGTADGTPPLLKLLLLADCLSWEGGLKPLGLSPLFGCNELEFDAGLKLLLLESCLSCDGAWVLSCDGARRLPLLPTVLSFGISFRLPLLEGTLHGAA